MALLSQEDQQFLRDHFGKTLRNDVTLAFFTQHQSVLTVPGQQCRFCKETGELLEEVAALNEHIKVETYDFVRDAETAKQYGVDKIPAVVLLGPESRGMKFYGIPSGYEFSTLIEDIVSAASGESGLSAQTKDELKKITDDTHIQVFVTPTCPYCPQAARLAHQMAIENPHIRGDVVEASEFPHLVQKYRIMGVPKTVVNETTQFEGAVPESRFLQEVMKAQKRKQQSG